MKKINFEDGTKVSNAKVTIDGVDYPVTPARYTGATPLSAYVMNKLQDNIENTIDQKADSSNVYTKTETDTRLNAKANSSDVYTKTEIDTKLNTKQDKLTAGTGIEITGENIINNLNANYSTDEQVIGKWIDGKPLYRKVIQKNVSAYANETYSLSSLGISNQDIVIVNLGKSTAHYISSITGGAYAPVSFYISSDDRALVYVNTQHNLSIQNQNPDERTYYIVLEYTKTTD